MWIFLAEGVPLERVDRVGAVIRKAEEGGVVQDMLQADARIVGSLPDLLAGGELGVLVGHIPAPAVAVGHMGMHRAC